MITGNHAVTDSNGIATFTSLSYTLAGSFYVKAQSDVIPSVYACSNQISISFTTLSSLSWLTQPGDGVAGVALSPQPVLSLIDIDSNFVSSATVTISFYTDKDCTIQAKT